MKSPGDSEVAKAAQYRRGGLFWHRDFRLFWGGETASDLGDAMASVALPLVAVAVLHASALVVSALTAATYVPYLVFGLPAGALIDRWPARRMMMLCDGAQLVLFASLPVAGAIAHVTAVQLLVVAVLAGTCGMLFGAAYSIYVTELIAAEDLLEGNAKLQASSSVTRVAGPGLGGLVAQALGPVTALLFNAGSFLVSAACLTAINPQEAAAQTGPPTAQPDETPNLRREITEGVRLIIDDQFLRPQLVWAALINFGLAGYFALIVLYLDRTVGLPSGLVGLVLTVGGLGGVAGAVLAGRLSRRFGTARTFLFAGGLIMPVGLLTILAEHGPRLAFALVGVFGLEGGLVLGSVLLSAFEQSYVPAGALGRVKTTMRIVTYGIVPIGALVAGELADLLGARTALAIMIGTGATSVILLITGPFRGLRDLPTAPPFPG